MQNTKTTASSRAIRVWISFVAAMRIATLLFAGWSVTLSFLGIAYAQSQVTSQVQSNVHPGAQPDQAGKRSQRRTARPLIPAASGTRETAQQNSLRGRARPIPPDVWGRMRGKSWFPGRGCPSRRELALLEIPHLDFEGRRQVGKLIVAADVAEDVLTAFERLMQGGFRIERMRLVHEFRGNDNLSMAANNTSAFNCRLATGRQRLSAHAYGRAIDINPIQNPYVGRSGVQPPAGRAFATKQQRSRARIGMIRDGRVAYRAFRSIGWKWGGNWRYKKDYQHFSLSGR